MAWWVVCLQKCLAAQHPHTTTKPTQGSAWTQQKVVHGERKRENLIKRKPSFKCVIWAWNLLSLCYQGNLRRVFFLMEGNNKRKRESLGPRGITERGMMSEVHSPSRKCQSEKDQSTAERRLRSYVKRYNHSTKDSL